jgi:pimeloyl-ACP methyl ester carboxylesterase
MTFVLVPGAGGDPWYWHLVVERLARHGQRAIAVDVPGDDESKDLPDYVDAVIRASHGVADLVLVGQSLGGFSAAIASRRLPVRRLVFVNAMIPAPGETPGQWWANTGQPEAKAAADRRAGRDPDAEFDIETYFLHDLPPDVFAASAQHARDQAGRPFATPADFDGFPDVPIHAIGGRDDRFFPVEFQRRLARERLGIDLDEVPGGHLVALSHPDEVVERLESYLAE